MVKTKKPKNSPESAPEMAGTMPEHFQEGFVLSMLDTLPVALFCKDSFNEFRFVGWNRKAEEVFGLKREQVLGKNDYDFFPKDQADFFLKKDQETLAGGKRIEIPEEPVGKVLVRTSKVPMRDEQGRVRYLLGISEDISANKAAEKEMDRQRTIAIEASRLASLGEMSGGIAHEINNPLAIILGMTQSAQRHLSSENCDLEAVKRALTKVEATTQRIADIIKGLRLLSQNVTGDPFVPSSLTAIIKDALVVSRERFAGHGVKLTVDTEAEVFVSCRSVQISQVILNLLNNAFDAVQKTPEPWVRIGMKDLGQVVQIEVVDSGKGIPVPIAEKIMQPFFSTKTVGKGTGLGLSVSKGIVESHDGKLWLDRESPNTRFLVELPKKGGRKEPSAAA